jgi:DNA polymerase I-like protein with 3'-5' exonuclease and polymerase domains
MIFLEGDLTQIESRIVFLFTGDPELVRLAQLHSTEYDGHTENAKLLFGNDIVKHPDFRKVHRHVGKSTSHGAQRDMRGTRLSDNILKETNMVFTPERCEGFLTKYHNRYPAIRGTYFKDIRKQVLRDKQLVNSWGRRLDFRFDKVDDDLFRRAYSFLPQSEAADILNERGLMPLYHYLHYLYDRPPNVQVHDSLLCSVRPDDAYDVAEFMRANLEKPVLIAGVRFKPQVEFKLGINWGADEKLGEGWEFKRLPPRADFTAHAWCLEEARRAKTA